MRHLIFLLIGGLLAAPSVFAQQVLTSFKPIQMITLELTRGVSQPEVLLGANTSPHDYALRPSDIKRLNRADLIVWFGPTLEPFLTKVLEKKTNVFTISDIAGLDLLEFDHDEHHGDEHEDEHHHDHGRFNPHFWMGHEQTLTVAKALTAKLIEIDPDHQSQYQHNLSDFTAHLNQSFDDIEQKIEPVRSQGYYVFHDAYEYFEKDHQLNHLGHFTVSPERKPGAKTLVSIRQQLTSSNAKCVFAEPQFTPAIVESVVRGTQAKIGTLDPLGTEVALVPGSYFVFLNNMADNFTACLAQ
ncbi:zinc transport system substrate-binding protein [Vibrio xiamenensis]|uniref:High-affinity zinc uptake system protein ZnuA n=1 Tax=Vibrio xiamenensis TaxID=861298 RepID=A0A1G8EMY5_9VIBR|nr:zinc ABC transporter substrate-binding protein ZnuA [Vibrio xiamenensis]SDH71231.1 zinc transport system substrate-binding protein [Vibrio xiamenensis]